MSHTYEKLSSNKAKLTFAIPAEQFDEAMQKAYLKNRSRISVPGFRKGKAPRSRIEMMYGEGVFYDDALELIFADVYDAAVAEYDLKPVDRPDVNVEQIGAGQELKFTAEVFVRPDVELGQYKGLEVEITKQTVTEDEINARIEQDRQKASRTIDVDDRNVEDGDTVNLDYAGTVDGVAFAGGTAEGQTLTIGSHQFIPGFEEQMVGMAIGEEKDLNVTFPEQYHSEELSGKAAVFHVKVNGIKKTEMPALDDEFAADVSECDTFEEYKASIVKELEDRAAKNNDVMFENALVEKAVENATIDVPHAMIHEQLHYMMREMEMRMAYQGLRMEDYLKYTGQTREQLEASYHGEAEKRVRIELTLEAIRKAESIEPTEDEIKVQIEQQAERMGKAVEDFEKSLTDEQRAYLTDSAAIQKVVDLLKAEGKAVEKKPEEETEAAPKKKATRAKKTAEPKEEEAAE